jgi:tetratricopeptide (TPR) repeat protein
MPSRTRPSRAKIDRALLGLAASLAVCTAVCAQPRPSTTTQASQAPSAADGDELAALRRARDAMIGARDFGAALNPATVAVEEHQNAKDAAHALDVVALGRIQSELGDRDKAEKNLLNGIGLLEAAEGQNSLALVDPYRWLGRAYIKERRYPEAITALQEAQEISQRNLGLFNVEQSPLLDDITTAYLGVGDTGEARKLQVEKVDNAVKRFGADDPRVFPFRYQLADYYERSRMPVSARGQYEEVLKVEQSQLGDLHPGLAAPLRELVRIDLLTSQTDEKGSREKLAAVVERNPEMDPVERGLSLATLGDWAIVAHDPAAAREYYRQAWAAMSSKPDLDVREYFAKPTMIDFIAPLTAVDHGARSRPWAVARIDFDFDVSADGRPFNVAIAGAQGPLGEIESRYSRRLRETHFRPRLVDGVPVDTQNVQLSHYFRYYVNDKDKGDKDANGAESKDGG